MPMEFEGRYKSYTAERAERKKISDAELGNLISAFGNHEIKALTLALMKPGIVYSERNLNSLLSQSSGENVGARMNKRAGFGYCEDSLSPIGLVTREAIDKDTNVYGYSKLAYGEAVGDPLAGLLLDFSLKHPDFSLQDFFGNTATSSTANDDSDVDFKKRAPITRLKLYWELVTTTLPARSKDIADATGESERIVGKHLSALSDKGIVNYESVKQGGSRISYTLAGNQPDSDPIPYKHNRTVTENIVAILRNSPNTQWTHEEMRMELADQLLMNGKTVPESLGRTAEEVLSYLANSGYAQRGIFSVSKQSDVSLGDHQRIMIHELISLLDKFQNGDPATVEFGRKKLAEIIANPGSVSALIIKAREHSSNVQRVPISESSDHLKMLISSNPDVTMDELWETLRGEGRLISKAQLGKVIRILLGDGSISARMEKGVRHFATSPNDPSIHAA